MNTPLQSRAGDGPTPVSVVVPCCNEEPVLPHLRQRLGAARRLLAGRYRLHFVLVDDGSTDATWPLLGELFGSWEGCTLVRHPHNRGITAAFLTGLRASRDEIVCCMDSDCTYDPADLGAMIPLLADGVDLVTASPYHPRGRVLNVPPWRLALSRVSSALYRRVLRQKLATYTSCFRVYRKSAVAHLRVVSPGFQGIAEVLARMDLQGSRVVEFPTTLDVRKLGQSKLRVARTIAGHLRLLGRLAALRLLHRIPPLAALPAPPAPAPQRAA
jgi:glycosyltransferase involved in cell wall biosynthesis